MARALTASLLLFFFALMLGWLSSAMAEETGILSVTTTPVRGAIFVDNFLKGSSFWSGSLDAGSHQVSFGGVEGYAPPSPQIVTVVANQTVFIIGAYRKLISHREYHP